MMRKVQYKHWKTGETIVAAFLQWAQDNDGDGNPCPVALVEHPDGRVDTVYAGHITFIDESAGEQPADERRDVLACVGDLIEVARMPNIEYVADAHNAAVRKLRALAEKGST